MVWSGQQEGFALLRTSAEGGFVPAMAELGNHQQLGEEGLIWLRKAVEHNDPCGLHRMALNNPSARFALCTAAAKRGHPESMRLLGFTCFETLGSIECASLLARAMLLSGWKPPSTDNLWAGVKSIKAGQASPGEVQLVYNFGRELEGFAQFWDANHRLGLDYQYKYSIDVYLAVSHGARRAALQLILGLRERGVPRDVALMIAKFLYKSRNDAAAWWNQNNVY